MRKFAGVKCRAFDVVSANGDDAWNAQILASIHADKSSHWQKVGLYKVERLAFVFVND